MSGDDKKCLIEKLTLLFKSKDQIFIPEGGDGVLVGCEGGKGPGLRQQVDLQLPAVRPAHTQLLIPVNFR